MRIQNRSPFQRGTIANYKIENKTADNEATIYIYDEIGWFGLSAEQLVKDINDVDSKTLNIRFNTPGGSVFDGTAIFNAIKQKKAKTISHIDGLAASIASVIALASNEVRMAENAFLMIHEPWSMVIGDAEILREEADLLDKMSGTIEKVYIDKTGKEQKEIKALMKAETWMTAEEAKDMGFIDTIVESKEDERAKASLFDLSIYANVPDTLIGAKKELNERDLEKALRDAGCSRSQAKEILAKGFIACQDVRDAQTDGREDQDVRDAQTDNGSPQRDAEPVKAKDQVLITTDPVTDALVRAQIIMSRPTNS